MDHLKDTELHHYCQGLKKNQLPSELLSNDQLRHLSQCSECKDALQKVGKNYLTGVPWHVHGQAHYDKGTVRRILLRVRAGVSKIEGKWGPLSKKDIELFEECKKLNG